MDQTRAIKNLTKESDDVLTGISSQILPLEDLRLNELLTDQITIIKRAARGDAFRIQLNPFAVVYLLPDLEVHDEPVGPGVATFGHFLLHTPRFDDFVANLPDYLERAAQGEGFMVDCRAPASTVYLVPCVGV